ncbi:ParA family protein [Francisella philomiragia]|uniref:ParA family protein n=1 Tax=Francisella philomiragia TaxID=28110 RepID=UPI0035124455
MPTIVYASSKGGSGKTTACIILASELARQGISFTLVDGDPNKHLASWGKEVGSENVKEANQSNILDIIEEAENNTKFVLVDIEGSANMTMGYAISQADLVIIPCKPSDLDGKEAIKIAAFIRQQEKVLNRKIKHALLRTQTNAAIHTKIEQAIVNDFKEIGSIVFNNRLLDREAYKNIISYSCYIHDLEANNKREENTKNKAINTAYDYCVELIEIINK